MAAKHLFVLLLALFACIVAQSADELNIPDENDNQFPPDNHSDGIAASEVKVTTIEPDTPYQITESEIKYPDTKKSEEDSLVTVTTNDSSQTFGKTDQATNTSSIDEQSNISLTTSAVDDIPPVTDNVKYNTESVKEVSDDSGWNKKTERTNEEKSDATQIILDVTEAVASIDELKVTNSAITNEVVNNVVTEPFLEVTVTEPSLEVTVTEPSLEATVTEPSLEVTEPSDAVSESFVAVTSNTIHESDAMLAADEPQRVTEVVDTSDSFQTNIVETTDAVLHLHDVTGVTETNDISSEIQTTAEPIQTTWTSTQLFSTENNAETQTEMTQTDDEILATTTEIIKTGFKAFNIPLDIPNVPEETLTKSDVVNQDLKTTPELSKTSSENLQSPRQIDNVVETTDDTGEQKQIDLSNKTADPLMTFGNIEPSIVGIAKEKSFVTETTESTFRTTEDVLETTSSDTDAPTEITTESAELTTDLPEKILENGKPSITLGVNSPLVTEEPRSCPEGCICITELDSDDFKVDCSGRQLTALPKPLDPKTTELNLQNNNLTEISDEISALSRLKVLNANNNDIMEIMSGSLSKLPELTSLNLGNNRLLEYPQELVNFGLSKLKELDLGGNDMELKPETFSNYTSLRKLILPAAKSDIAKHLCNNLKDSLQTVCTGSCDIGYINCSDASEQLKGTLPGLIPLSNKPNNVDAAVDNKTELQGIKQIVGEVSQSPPSEDTVGNVKNAVQVSESVIIPTEAKNTLATEKAKSPAPSGIENAFSKTALPGLIPITTGTVVNENENKSKDQPTVNTGKVEDVATQSNDFSLRSAISKEPATDSKDKVDNTSSTASKANAEIAVGAATEANKGGVDKSVIGIIVAGMVLVVAGVTIKKNWKSIKNKFNSSPRTANDRVTTNGTTSPEEVPLQQKLPV